MMPSTSAFLAFFDILKFYGVIDSNFIIYSNYYLLICSALHFLWLYIHLPGSSVHGILQAGILEWVGLPFLSPGDLLIAGI